MELQHNPWPDWDFHVIFTPWLISITYTSIYNTKSGLNTLLYNTGMLAFCSCWIYRDVPWSKRRLLYIIYMQYWEVGRLFLIWGEGAHRDSCRPVRQILRERYMPSLWVWYTLLGPLLCQRLDKAFYSRYSLHPTCTYHHGVNAYWPSLSGMGYNEEYLHI